jgi:hypothetical protein
VAGKLIDIGQWLTAGIILTDICRFPDAARPHLLRKRGQVDDCLRIVFGLEEKGRLIQTPAAGNGQLGLPVRCIADPDEDPCSTAEGRDFFACADDASETLSLMSLRRFFLLRIFLWYGKNIFRLQFVLALVAWR